MRSSPPIDRLVGALKRLPGIGEKSATRLAFFLLGAPEAVARELAEAISRLKQEIVLCEVCFDLTDQSPCAVCRDPRRDPTLLCVVEEPADLEAIERSQRFHGRYHVLGGAFAPIEGVGPGDLRIDELLERVRKGEVQEVILATNPNAEGDATAHYIGERLREVGSGDSDSDASDRFGPGEPLPGDGPALRISRIAYGMPLGGDLEYADHVTVGICVENRRALS